MFTYWKMKKHEWKIKTMIYGTIVSLINNQKDILELLQKMYAALKDVPADEFRAEFVNALAQVIHEGNNNTTE